MGGPSISSARHTSKPLSAGCIPTPIRVFSRFARSAGVEDWHRAYAALSVGRLEQ